MNPDLKARWVDELRSGRWKQGRVFLRDGNTYCCLGVLAELMEPGSATESNLLSDEQLTRAGLTLDQQSDLAGRNDTGSPFTELATYIETNL